MYSGKVKYHSGNTGIAINKSKIIVWISKMYEGSRHDLPIGLEIVGTIKRLGNENIAKKYKTIIRADRGYLGLQKKLPGSIVVVPSKKGKGKELTGTQKERNLMLNRKRMPVEHVFKDMKEFAILRDTYSGSMEELNDDINLVAGLLNLRRLLPQIKSGRGPYGKVILQPNSRRR